MSNQPVVFISSTIDDLSDFRIAVRDLLGRNRYEADMAEYFPASSDNPPLQICLERAASANVLVVIVAMRFGWRPLDAPNLEKKSITWLECEAAAAAGKAVLPFILADECIPKWPVQLCDAYDLVYTRKQSSGSASNCTQVSKNVRDLHKLKTWLTKNASCKFFTTPDDLALKVLESLGAWRTQRLQTPHVADDGCRPYFAWLLEQTKWINIQGLRVRGNALRFQMSELFIPLSSVGETEGQGSSGLTALMRLDMPSRIRLVLVGGPGTGKTTFLRRIASELAAHEIERVERQRRDGDRPRRFPVFARLRDLADFVRKNHRQGRGPATLTSHEWILEFLLHQQSLCQWRISRDHYVASFEDGSVILLLDGLDETVDRKERELVSSLLSSFSATYELCSIVVTTRPRSYTEKRTIPGFDQLQIAPLAPPNIQMFLRRWSTALFKDDPDEVDKYFANISEAVLTRSEIRYLARTPVMLTALAGIYWNDRRLPGRRAELMESVIMWLSGSRDSFTKQWPAENAIDILQELALAMQSHPAGRQVEVSLNWAVQQISHCFGSGEGQDAARTAESFLVETEESTGIVVIRGSELRFWHLVFQEYLAARALAGRPDHDLSSVVFEKERGLMPEWREVMLLLGGVLRKAGIQRFHWFIQCFLSRVSPTMPMEMKARYIGLIGSILGDVGEMTFSMEDISIRSIKSEVLAVFDGVKSRDLGLSTRLEVAEALGQAGDPRLQTMNFVPCLGGRFNMGSDEAKPSVSDDRHASQDDEYPHEVYVSPFEIAVYPVTVQEFAQFVDQGGYENPEWWKSGGFGLRKQPKNWDAQLTHPSRPVVDVSWFEACAFCACREFRLPTEAEWERAARGATGRKYAWGEEEPTFDRANFSSNVGHPTPVGLFPGGVTPEGLHDVAGNVWEWVGDWFDPDYYRVSEGQNPRGPVSGTRKVVRGGSWADTGPTDLRAAARFSLAPDDSVGDIGFRCVRDSAHR